MEPQQSKLYAKYIQSLGWQVVTIHNTNIFFKRIPFVGVLAKMHRPKKLPPISDLISVLKDHHVRTIAVEPDLSISPKRFHSWIQKLSHNVRVSTSPFLPTKTIRVDITPPEEQLFHHFSEAKRRGVRRALKHGVEIKQSSDIHDLIRIKNTSSGLFGFITTYGITNLWKFFAPDHAAILLAYHPHQSKMIGGILLLFWDDIAYYWIAGATHQGKKLFAPTLLVWEAMKLSKKHGCTSFDFVGVWDERKPGQYTEWKGFTKFKEGFGGTEFYYPIAMPHK